MEDCPWNKQNMQTFNKTSLKWTCQQKTNPKWTKRQRCYSVELEAALEPPPKLAKTWLLSVLQLRNQYV